MAETRFPAFCRLTFRLASCVTVTLALAGCFDSGPSATAGAQSGAIPTTSSGTTSNNTAPKVNGTPATEIPAGFPYVFKPTVVDAEGDAVTLKASGVPRWAVFDAASGELRGTPAETDIGVSGGIVLTATDGRATTTFGPFAVNVKRSSTLVLSGSRPPVIQGQPASTVAAGSGYTFQAVASDPDGDRLVYGAQNLPSWLGINTANGLLTGTPSAAQVGAYPNIVISVTDGNSTVSLPTFTITVTASSLTNTSSAATGSTGSATLSWLKPTQNTDGTPLRDLSGFIVKYGHDAASLSERIVIADPNLIRYTVDRLAPGTWYFTVVSFTAVGLESDVAPQVSKTIY